MNRIQFPNDKDNRIQKLYYDININTIFNRTKLQNHKNKFLKYDNYINKEYFNNIQPKLLELEKKRDEAYKECQRAKRISLIHNPTPENVKKRQALVPIFRKADDEYEEMKREEQYYYTAICDIDRKIKQIKNHKFNIYRHYKKCAHCEIIRMTTNSGCKLNHKLCSDCSYDIKECPICNEDLGLQYCAICMENKKKIVEIGCKNKHQTCKQCLDKIRIKNNLCPFCRDSCSKELPVPTLVEGTGHTVEEMEEVYVLHGR